MVLPKIVVLAVVLVTLVRVSLNRKLDFVQKSSDMSPGLFEELAPLSQGVVHIRWNFMARGWKP